MNSADSFPQLPALPPGSMSVEKSEAHFDNHGYYKRRLDHASSRKRKSTAIYELQMREYIARRRNENASWKEIAAELGQSEATIRRYHKAALGRVVELVPYTPQEEERFDEEQPWHRERKRPGTGSASHTRRRKGKDPDPVVEGEVLMSPDETIIREKCLLLIKSQQPYPTIAKTLGISEKDARRYVHEELKKLEDSELNNADLERRLMVEQLNQMIEAIHPSATGQRVENGEIIVFAPVLDAVDRMLKLMKQKADLMGLNKPQTVDIQIKLKLLAEEAGYDVEELEDIAREVLAKYNVRLPGS